MNWRLLVAGFLLVAPSTCAPAFAQSIPWVDDEPPAPMLEAMYYEDPGPDDAWFGRVVIVNLLTTDNNRLVTFETKHGEIVIDRDTTPNIDCLQSNLVPTTDPKCADTWEVIKAPQNVLARPWGLVIPETRGGTIFLYEWNGT